MPRPKKILLWVCVALGALLVLCLVLLIFKNPLLRSYAVYQVERETGAEASIGSFKVDLISGSVHVQDFRLRNPPGFGDSLLLRMPELYLRLDGEAARKGVLRLDEARVNISELNVVKNTAGQTNIFELEKHSRARRKKKRRKPDRITFGGIGELHLSLGTLRYTDMQNSTNNYEFVIGIEDEVVTTIKNEDDLETWGKALLVRITIQQLVKQAQQRGRLRELLEQRRPKREGIE